MKQILFLILFSISFTTSISAQRKPTTKTVKTTPQKITEQQATTNDGKPVTLKSDGTWQFSMVEISQPAKAKPCELTLKDAPTIRGLKLGMSKDEFDAFLNSQKIFEDRPAYGATSNKYLSNDLFLLTYLEYSLKPYLGFRGINSLELSFFNKQIHSIKVEYSKSEANFTDEEFRLKLIESLNLPNDNWSYSSLKCAEFEVYVASGDTLILTNLLTSKEIEESEKRKRDTFKP